MKGPFNIYHKTGWVATISDMGGLARVKQWLTTFDPKMYTDKTLKAEDFYILDSIGNLVEL